MLHGKLAGRPRPFVESDTFPTAAQIQAARVLLDFENVGKIWSSERLPALFEAFLLTKGAMVELSVQEPYGQGYASTAAYRFRYRREYIQIGVRKTFDRWANSVDFVVESLPTSEVGCDALLLALDDAVHRNLRADVAAWEPYDLTVLVKKHRARHLARNRRG
ncbi:hypothetical protein AS149_14785 [Burkholderia cenocepacia]|nr:hypothetical protein AS149_14785 [Burkholderia cenocepacia]